MPNFNIAQVGTNLGVGIADGFLARQDVTSPDRWNQPKMHRSLWLEGAAVIGGLVLGSQSRSAQMQMAAESLVLSGGALLARRVGVYAAETQEDPSPAKYPTGVQPVPAQYASVASGQVMRAVPFGGNGEYVNSGSRVALRQSQNAWL